MILVNDVFTETYEKQCRIFSNYFIPLWIQNERFMNDQIKQIAERLRGLREVLDLTAEEVARSCQMSVDDYLGMESGKKDISVSALQQIARKYGIALDVLMFGEEPKMNAYFLTRRGKGVSVERTKAYKYQSLASGFRGRKMNPFIVTIEPKKARLSILIRTKAKSLIW